MVGPARKREAVTHVQETLCTSQRRACSSLNQPRSMQRRRAEQINQVWSYDFVFNQTEMGARLKWLPVLDEYSRECLSQEVERTMTARDVVQTLQRLVAERGAPEFFRSDNGPEFVADAVKEWLRGTDIGTLHIEPGAPWQNAYSESFNSRLRDEFLNVELFASTLEAKGLGREHREKYNHQRPHSSLGDLTPVEFAARCLAPLRPFDFVKAACAPQASVFNPITLTNLS